MFVIDSVNYDINNYDINNYNIYNYQFEWQEHSIYDVYQIRYTEWFGQANL